MPGRLRAAQGSRWGAGSAPGVRGCLLEPRGRKETRVRPSSEAAARTHPWLDQSSQAPWLAGAGPAASWVPSPWRLRSSSWRGGGLARARWRRGGARKSKRPLPGAAGACTRPTLEPQSDSSVELARCFATPPASRTACNPAPRASGGRRTGSCAREGLQVWGVYCSLSFWWQLAAHGPGRAPAAPNVACLQAWSVGVRCRGRGRAAELQGWLAGPGMSSAGARAAAASARMAAA